MSMLEDVVTIDIMGQNLCHDIGGFFTLALPTLRSIYRWSCVQYEYIPELRDTVILHADVQGPSLPRRSIEFRTVGVCVGGHNAAWCWQSFGQAERGDSTRLGCLPAHLITAVGD